MIIRTVRKQFLRVDERVEQRARVHVVGGDVLPVAVEGVHLLGHGVGDLDGALLGRRGRGPPQRQHLPLDVVRLVDVSAGRNGDGRQGPELQLGRQHVPIRLIEEK